MDELALLWVLERLDSFAVPWALERLDSTDVPCALECLDSVFGMGALERLGVALAFASAVSFLAAAGASKVPDVLRRHSR
jgi:hypothetical protein